MMGCLFIMVTLAILIAGVQSFRLPSFGLKPQSTKDLHLSATITDGVEFDTIAREWRLKWSADNNKESLSLVQNRLNDLKTNIQSVPGLKSVQRIVCGGCLDYKVIVSVSADKFGEWVSSMQYRIICTNSFLQESNQFKPEADFLAGVKSIPGVNTVETQTYTIMPVI